MYNLKHIPHIIYFLLIPKYKLCYVCIGTETNPFRHDDEDKYIIHDMIQQGTRAKDFYKRMHPRMMVANIWTILEMGMLIIRK